MTRLLPSSSLTALSAHITDIPFELIQQILSYLSPVDLVSVLRTCSHLYAQANNDQLWQDILQQHLPISLNSPAPCSSFRDLFAVYFPYWFLVRHKIWYSDNGAGGRLIIVRYDPRRGCIEGYALAAERKPTPYGTLDWDGGVVYHTFEPKVQLDLNLATLRLQPPKKPKALVQPLANKLKSEAEMDIHDGTNERLVSRLLLSMALPRDAIAPNVALWPPLILPSPNDSRVRVQSPSDFRSPGQKPANLSQLSESTFRIRQWVQFNTFNPLYEGLGPSRLAEEVSTYATLPEDCYRPTPQKPFQGIWVGDYSGHGCEFLLIHQPSDPIPLPDMARQAIEHWPRAPKTVFVEAGYPWTSESEELAEDAPLVDSIRTANSGPSESLPYNGRLEAIKLTGDPNVPRGEYTFIADDIGPRGLVGFAHEDIFVDSDSPSPSASPFGTRTVKCIGHIAGRGFKDDLYIPTQLMLISENKLAHYWKPFGHVSFYQRVDIDKFLGLGGK